MNIHFIQHESFETPGAYLNWARERGHAVSFSKVYLGQPLPPAIGNIDLLIIMGGPQSPDTTQKDCPYFNATAEKAFIKKALDQKRTVIGVCLGAQLIGEALGAPYEHSPETEIGNFPVYLTESGKKEENLSLLPDSLKVGHWHNDMPGLTENARILAFSEGCPRQIIKYKKGVYGMQCHFELTREVAGALIRQDPELEKKSKTNKFVQAPPEILNYDYSEMNKVLYHFLDRLAGESL